VRIYQLCLIGATVLLGTALLGAAILDPTSSGPDAALLRSLAQPLHQKQIDTILGDATAFPPASRARLASLLGFKVEKEVWANQPKEGWSLAFEEGLLGAVVAYKPPTLSKFDEVCRSSVQVDPEGCRFVSDWLSADPEQRLFIAFTRSDVDIALAVKEVLERQGYVVFIYLRNKVAKPWADPSLVGEVFAQAGHRLVIDTPNSRGSDGVAAEQKICESLLTTRRQSKLATMVSTGKVPEP
jgi:hypothetical protein